MLLPVLNTIDDVVARQLCSGCGACAGVAPDHYEMIDTLEHGRRPRRCDQSLRDTMTTDVSSAAVDDAFAICPGRQIVHTFDRSDPACIRELMPGWGPVLEVWEGFAADDAVRFAGSSGGAATALALHCLEQQRMHGVLHIRARPDAPLLNETVLSTKRVELLAATGSRYAPASPCEGLPRIERAPAPCVFIGKPCDVSGAVAAASIRPKLERNLGLTIAIFCAGTPTTHATLRLLAMLGVDDPRDVLDLRYRGNGWPGDVTLTIMRDGRIEQRTMSYDDAWGGVLTNEKQWRCHVCADHTGEHADISVGDPWHRPITPGDPGRSLILVRTERGRRILHDAMRSGALTVQRVEPGVLPASQPNLLRGRGAVWGRLLGLRLLRLPMPRYHGFPMLRFWLRTLTLGEKIRSVAGIFRRARTRGLRKNLPTSNPMGFGEPGIGNRELGIGNREPAIVPTSNGCQFTVPSCLEVFGPQDSRLHNGASSMTLLQKLADVDDPGSLSNRMRTRRFERFERMIESLPRPLRIIDLGGTPDFWMMRGWMSREVCIVCINLEAQESAQTNLRCVRGDVTDLRCFADMSFDVAFSNSVIEHLGSFERQKRMADEMRRLAPALWLQTPNYWFPIEPHFHVPGWQWMPAGVRRAMLQRTRCGWRGPCPDPAEADALVREVRLLTRRELEQLFPRADIQPERFSGLVKSWMVHSGFESSASRRPALRIAA